MPAASYAHMTSGSKAQFRLSTICKEHQELNSISIPIRNGLLSECREKLAIIAVTGCLNEPIEIRFPRVQHARHPLEQSISINQELFAPRITMRYSPINVRLLRNALDRDNYIIKAEEIPVEHQGTMMKIVSMEVIDRDAAWPALMQPIRVALRLLTVEDFLRIRFESLPTNRVS